MAVPAADRARLVALKNEGAQAYHVGKGLAMFVGGMKLRSSDGAHTNRGRVWEEMCGSEPVRFHGEMQRSGNTKYIDMDGTRHVLQKLARTP